MYVCMYVCVLESVLDEAIFSDMEAQQLARDRISFSC